VNDAFATCSICIERSVPASVKAVSAKSMSAVSASMKWAAKRLQLHEWGPKS
jgi:hypothetical protein